MSKKMKDILWGVFAVAMVVIFVVLLLNDDLEHIEDTNGPDDYSLTTITDENIINMDMGALTPVKVTQTDLNVGSLDLTPMVEFSSGKFTGVHEICHTNLVGKSDFVLELGHLTVDSGNFKMVVVHDDEIVATIEPSEESIYFCLEDINGYVSVRIAGESAAYSFNMFKADYDLFSHD